MPYKKSYAKRPKRFARKTYKRCATTGTRMMTRPKRSIYHKDHFFNRCVDWSDIYASQGNTFNGSYGLAASPSSGVTVAFSGNLLAVTVSAATAGYVSFAFSPMLQTVLNYGEYTSLFDMYRLHGFSARLTPLQNNFMAPFTGTDGSNALYAIGSCAAIIHSVLDWDDNNTVGASPSGVALLRDYLTYRWKALTGTGKGTYHKLYCKRPGVKIVTGSGNNDAGGNVVTLIKRSPLLDCATTNINHHGMKIVLELTNNFSSTSSVWYFKVESKLWASFTQPR